MDGSTIEGWMLDGCFINVYLPMIFIHPHPSLTHPGPHLSSSSPKPTSNPSTSTPPLHFMCCLIEDEINGCCWMRVDGWVGVMWMDGGVNGCMGVCVDRWVDARRIDW